MSVGEETGVVMMRASLSAGAGRPSGRTRRHSDRRGATVVAGDYREALLVDGRGLPVCHI